MSEDVGEYGQVRAHDNRSAGESLFLKVLYITRERGLIVSVPNFPHSAYKTANADEKKPRSLTSLDYVK